MTDDRRRLLRHSAFVVAPRDRLVCAAIVRPDTASDLAPDIMLDELLPHDAEVLLDRTDPDVVLVESRALTAGHAWAGAGEPSVVDPSLRLLRALEISRSRGIPSVLWWSDVRAETPALIPFERHFDFVLSSDGGGPSVDMPWSPGVQLARFAALPDADERNPRPAWHARWDRVPSRRLRAAMRNVDGGVGGRPELWIDGDITAAPAWVPSAYGRDEVRRVETTALGAWYRSRRVFVAERLVQGDQPDAVPTSVLRQLAAGARVISGPNEALDDAVGPWIDWARVVDAIRDVIAASASLDARDQSDQRSLLRRLFLTRDTTVAVSRLATLIGSPRATPRRDVCLVADLAGDVAPTAIVDAVTRQQFRPAAAVLVGGDASRAASAVAELDAVGVRSRWLASHTLPGGQAAPAAELTSAAWIWPWSPSTDYEPTFLIDAVIDALAGGLAVGDSTVGLGDGLVGTASARPGAAGPSALGANVVV